MVQLNPKILLNCRTQIQKINNFPAHIFIFVYKECKYRFNNRHKNLLYGKFITTGLHLFITELRFMAKRIFISFAIEDVRHRDFLVGQAKNSRTPFELIDMSVKEPWSESWKTSCRTKIKGCDGMIALVSKNTANAFGALFEVRCAKEEKVPVRGIYATIDGRPGTLPSEFAGVRVMDWTWDNVKSFIDSL